MVRGHGRVVLKLWGGNGRSVGRLTLAAVDAGASPGAANTFAPIEVVANRASAPELIR